MRTDTAKRAADLLAAVSTTLKTHGRPRKRPGRWRSEAETAWGRGVRARHPNAVRWSLLGAVKADAKALGYNRTVMEAAAMAALEEAHGDDWWYGTPFEALDSLDDRHYDTRQIVRIVRRAAITLEKQANQTAERPTHAVG